MHLKFALPVDYDDRCSIEFSVLDPEKEFFISTKSTLSSNCKRFLHRQCCHDLETKELNGHYVSKA